MGDYQFKQTGIQQQASTQKPWDTEQNQLEVYEWQQGDFISTDL